MRKTDPKIELQLAIQLLEIKCHEEGLDLKEDLIVAFESIKPINILKETVRNLKGTNDVGSEVSSLAIGAASGYLVKNILFGVTKNPVIKLAGIILQTFVANIASQNSEGILAFGSKVLESVKSKIKTDKYEFSEREIYDYRKD